MWRSRKARGSQLQQAGRAVLTKVASSIKLSQVGQRHTSQALQRAADSEDRQVLVPADAQLLPMPADGEMAGGLGR